MFGVSARTTPNCSQCYIKSMKKEGHYFLFPVHFTKPDIMTKARFATATRKEKQWIRSHFGVSFAPQFQGTIVWDEIDGRKCHLHLDPETDQLMIIFCPEGQMQTTAAPATAETEDDMIKLIKAEQMLRKFTA